jgi:bifunctional oligoribonuclease and PAP phosphatase NrnA
MNQTSEIKTHLSKAKNIIITTHHKPDGDAMGSTLGLWHYLTSLGHTATILSPTDYGHFLHWMPGNEKVVIYTDDPNHAITLLEASDTIFGLDFSALNRANEIGAWMKENHDGRCFIMMDHHLNPESWDDFRIWDDNASSTAELVYRFIIGCGDNDRIDTHTAECIYTGIMTDTGSFKYSNTSAAVHRIVADLLERGAISDMIHNRLFDSATETRIRFLGFCLYEKLVVLPEYKTAYMAITHEELERFNSQTGDTEGLVNYALSIIGVNFGVLIVDRKVLRKMSFRSIGQFPANQFAAHFNGGGHFNAAGGMSEDTLENTEKKFLNLLEQYKDQLQYE